MLCLRWRRTGGVPHRCCFAVGASAAAASSAAAALMSLRSRSVKHDEVGNSSVRHPVDTTVPLVDEGAASREPPTRRAWLARPDVSVYPRVRVALHEHSLEREQQREREEEEAGGGPEAKLSSANERDAVAVDSCDSHNTEDEVRAFLGERERELEQARLQRNATIPYPTHPDDMIPEFRRVKRHQAMVVVATDPEYPVYQRRDQFVQLPPPAMHPWVKNTPVGPFIPHGDGQLGVVGSGEVGFDSAHATETLPRGFRGLQHHSVLQRQLPQKNGKVIQDAVVKNSFTLTGRGVFTTRDVVAGETIMILQSTARNLGVKGEIERLVEMCGDVLLAVHEAKSAEDLDFLHSWVLTGQPSSLLEYWPVSATQQVLERIGGVEMLRALELHEIHIARLAAIIDMNSFLVESAYGVRKGMAYFPEAGFLNHSCAPNATYDVIPEHIFQDTDYYVDEVEGALASGGANADATAAAASTLSSPQSGTLSTGCDVCHLSAEASSSGTAVCRASGTDGPKTYLFCCRATTDIAAGTEIVISYVPHTWSFDNRQYVLHDRYRFWCKCPRCAPTLDATYARVPRLIVALLLFSIALQLLVMNQRNKEQMAAREHQTEEGIVAEGGNHAAFDHHRSNTVLTKRSHGLFEMMEEDRLQGIFSPDRGPMPGVLANDPWARPPR